MLNTTNDYVKLLNDKNELKYDKCPVISQTINIFKWHTTTTAKVECKKILNKQNAGRHANRHLIHAKRTEVRRTMNRNQLTGE